MPFTRRNVIASFVVPAAALWLTAPGSRWAGEPTRALIVLLYVVPLVDYARSGDPLETSETYAVETGVLERHVRGDEPPTVLITDPHSAFVLPFYLPESARESTMIVDWAQGRKFARQHDRRKLVYVHRSRLRVPRCRWMRVRKPESVRRAGCLCGGIQRRNAFAILIGK